MLATGTSFPPLYTVNLATGETTTIPNTFGGRVARLTPDGTAMYVAGSYMMRMSLEGSSVSTRTNYDVSSCNNIWLTEDARRVITACGRLYRTSSIVSEDLQANGSLAPLSSIISADHSIAAHTIAVIPNASFGSTSISNTLQLYDDNFLDFAGIISLPPFLVNDSPFAGYGQFVSWNADGTQLIVVEKADDKANLAAPFGVAVISPATGGQNPFTVVNRDTYSLTALNTSPTTTVGSARIAPAAGSSVPSGLAIFASRLNGILVSEATVPAVMAIRSGRLYAEVNATTNTGVAIANPNSTPAHITFYFTAQNGTKFGSGTTTVPANGQIAAFLSEPPFRGGSSVDGTFTFDSDVGVGAIALRGLVNERDEFLWTTTPVFNVNGYPYNQMFPSFADGGGWSTQFVLVNNSSSTVKGTLRFLPPDQRTPFRHRLRPASPSMGRREISSHIQSRQIRRVNSKPPDLEQRFKPARS